MHIDIKEQIVHFSFHIRKTTNKAKRGDRETVFALHC